MRSDHKILSYPLRVRHNNGRLQVLKMRATEQGNMGEALTLDTIVNSIDAELIATGPSGKGPNRGAIVRHGRYVLWCFEGFVSEMTDSGKALFVNTLHYTATCARASVLEKHGSIGTRDTIYESLGFIKTECPGYLATLKGYLPSELADKKLPDVEKWYLENRQYLRLDYRRFEVDTFAKDLEVANHKIAYLKRCIHNLEDGKLVNQSLAALKRYTGLDYTKPFQWRNWYTENEKYLYFSDCEGFIFKVDEEAKGKHIPTAVFRKWSSESLDYRYNPSDAEGE